MTRRPKWYRPSVRKLGRWHQLMGLIAAVFVVLVSVTGILLNHTGEFALDRRYVQAQWMLDWYGIRAPDEMASYRAADHWVTQIGERVYFDEQEIPGHIGRLIGAVSLKGVIVVAADGHLLLLSDSGLLIERLGGQQGVPAGMKAVGVGARQQLLIRAAHGIYHSDKDLLTWRETPTGTADWAAPTEAPAALYETLRRQYRGRGLTVERLLLDLHSGRILGSAGTLMLDVAALLMILLAVTGMWIWAKRRKS
jgi:hypothetical protein